jgi:hypothetical protein
MARQRGGNRGILISILVVIVITGIVIGALFATGVLGKKTASGGSTPPSGSGTEANIRDPGTVSITDLENIPGSCIPPSPCQGSQGVGYTITSTCGDPIACSMEVDFTTVYKDGTYDTTTQIHPGIGGVYELNFQSFTPTINGLGQTRIPQVVTVSGYSIYNGVKGKQSTPVSIQLF